VIQNLLKSGTGFICSGTKVRLDWRKYLGGFTEKKSEIGEQMTIAFKKYVILVTAVSCFFTGCPGSSTKGGDSGVVEEEAGFGHGTLRPECRYTPANGRTPWFPEPVVVDEGAWGKPVILEEPVTDSCPNDAIELSSDDKTLYFYWSPTVEGSHEELLHAHTGTYMALRVGEDFGVFYEPTYFGLQKGVEGGSVDGVPNFTPDGDYVYFHSTRSDNLGFQESPPVDDYLDIYKAPVINGEPGTAVNLGEPVNSIYLDGEHGLSPDGSKLFISSTRPGGEGDVDIWVSEMVEGHWSEPVNLGPPINTEHTEAQPGFAVQHPETMFFTSNRDGPSSIYRSTNDGIQWSEPEMVITGYVGEPTPTSDGRVLYFVHVLVDDDGVFGSNIWYIQRTE